MRTESAAGFSGLRLQSWDPQAEQKTFVKPSAGSNARRSSSPAVTASEPGTMCACADAAVPVLRWQRVQWQ
jgi:hypothetical protein